MKESKSLTKKSKKIHIDSFITSDSTSKKIRFSSNNTNIRSLSTSTSRKKLIFAYMKSVTKENSLLKYAQSNKEFSNNIIQLEKRINLIKIKGLYKNINNILNKHKIIVRLEESINYFLESLNRIRRTKSQMCVDKGKAQNENDKMKEKSEKVDKEKGKYLSEINSMKKEISTIPLEIQNYKNETVLYAEEYMKVCNEICEVNAKIKNVNLKISAIKKENERITALNIKNKNSVISIKDSIFSKMNRSTNFMLNVNSLVSSEGYL